MTRHPADRGGEMSVQMMLSQRCGLSVARMYDSVTVDWRR